MASSFVAAINRNAVAPIGSIRDAPAMLATASTSLRSKAGACRTRFINRKNRDRPGSVPLLGLGPVSRGELLEDVLHRRGALLPGGELGVDPQLLGAGEPRVAALLADEVDDLAAIKRRVLHELQLHRVVRRVHARDTKRPRGDAHHMAFDERTRGLGQLAEAVDELLPERLELLARLGVRQALVERQALVHVAAV